MKKIILSSLFYLLIIIVNANNLDSLNTIWNNKSISDSIRLKTALILAKQISLSNKDSSNLFSKSVIFYINSNFPIENSSEYFHSIKGDFYFLQSVNYYRLGQIENATQCLDSSMAIHLKLNAERAFIEDINLKGILYQYQNNYDSALANYQLYYRKVEALKDTALMLKSINNQAGIYVNLQQLDTAINLRKKQIELSKKIHNQSLLGDAYRGLGNIYYYKGQYILALEVYNKAIKIYEKLKDNHGLINAWSNIALVYKDQEEYEVSMKYCKKVLQMEYESENRKGVADSHISIASLYSAIGNLDSCIWYNYKALKLHTQIQYKPGIAMSMSNLSSNLAKQDSLHKAILYGESSLKMYRELNNKWGEVYTQSSLSVTYLKAGKNNLAIKNAKEAYQLSIKINLPNAVENASRNYYTVLRKNNNYKQALFKLEEANKIMDSLKTEEIKKQTVRTQLQYEYDKKTLQDSIAMAQITYENELSFRDQINSEKTKRNVLLYLSLITVIISGGLFSRLNYIRKSKLILQKEKERSDTLLLNILPEEIAQELKEKGSAKARNYDMVSILFSDFKSFTETSAILSASELVAEINYCFEAFDYIIEKYNIEKIKTIGDAYMAAGGLPNPMDTSIKNTVLAAIEMQAFITKRKEENNSADKPAFEMRVGIHTGPVVAGIVGVKKFQYDIWGDTVNTANRIETNGEVNKVNISEATYSIIKNDPLFKFESRGKIKVKGKGEIEMYFVELNET